MARLLAQASVFDVEDFGPEFAGVTFDMTLMLI